MSERSTVRVMCGVSLKDGERSKDLMLGLNESIDQLAVASSAHWHCHVLRREDGHVLRREDGDVLRREDGHVLRREVGDVLRREDGHVLRREDGHVLRREVGDVLAVAISAHCHVLCRENVHVLRMVLDFEDVGQIRNGHRRGHGESRLRRKV